MTAVVIEGVTQIAIDRDEYERLERARRQLGGQMHRLSVLKQRLREHDALLDAITDDLEPHEATHPVLEADAGCPLCSIREHIATRPHAERSRIGQVPIDE